ncbi:hypothetical protein [Paenibacillus sp. 2TAB26]
MSFINVLFNISAAHDSQELSPYNDGKRNPLYASGYKIKIRNRSTL